MATKTAQKAAEASGNGTSRKGRKPASDKLAPHGRDADGTPKAPYGYLDNGNPRQYPLVETDIPELSLDELGDIEAPPADALALTKPVSERSDRQKSIDAVVQRLHRTWEAKGKPRGWNDALNARVVGGFWVAPNGVEGLKRLIDRAGRFAEVSVKYGSLVGRRPGMEQDGKQYLPFFVRDVQARATKPDDNSGE